MKRGWASLMAIVAVIGCTNDNTVEPGNWNSYRNPVEQSDMQDPAVIEVDGKFYLFSAGVSQSVQEGDLTSIVPMMESEDLITWQRAASVFNEDTRPTFIGGVLPACPEIAEVEGNYLLYYSLSESYGNSGIGVAVAGLVSGPYEDKGSVIKASGSVSGVSSPSFICDNGTNYLVFGNFNGIYIVRLSENGLATAGNPIKIASTVFDAPYIHKYGDKYYLFATVGVTEGGEACTCTQVVGRADRIDGPYYNKSNDKMEVGYSELLIGNSSKFVGAGHGTVFDVADGSTWILYNAYDLSKVDKGRVLMLDRIEWIGGWPSVRGRIGSFCADTPVVNK